MSPAGTLRAKLAAGLLAFAVLGAPAMAAEEGGGEAHYPLKEPERQAWSFAGPFGRYDAEQLRRGLAVYRTVCANCHGMSLVPFRTLTDPYGPALTDAEMRDVAASFQIPELNDQGQRVTRPGRPTDHFPSPFPSAAAAASLNNGAAPPDLSLMAKARSAGGAFPWFILNAFTQYQEGGPDYIHALLTGYVDAPAGMQVSPGTFYNPYFVAGPALAMSPQLFDEMVPYPDGAPETAEQYARDVSAFLMWAAEPKLAARKRLGFEVMIFLLVFGTLMYLTKRSVWARVAH